MELVCFLDGGSMLELLYRLFIGHTHKYEIIDYATVQSTKTPNLVNKVIYIQKCTVCGKLHQTTICDK